MVLAWEEGIKKGPLGARLQATFHGLVSVRGGSPYEYEGLTQRSSPKTKGSEMPCPARAVNPLAGG